MLFHKTQELMKAGLSKALFLPLGTASTLGGDAHIARKSLCSNVAMVINLWVSQRNISE